MEQLANVLIQQVALLAQHEERMVAVMRRLLNLDAAAGSVHCPAASETPTRLPSVATPAPFLTSSAALRVLQCNDSHGHRGAWDPIYKPCCDTSHPPRNPNVAWATRMRIRIKWQTAGIYPVIWHLVWRVPPSQLPPSSIHPQTLTVNPRFRDANQ